MSRGFQCEEHTVVTEDGYILGIFRVINPYVKPTARLKPVLIWHGFFGTSDIWVVYHPGYLNQTGHYSENNGSLINNCVDRLTTNLPFTLAACGYDVWLGNTRSNRYSPRHISIPSYSMI